MTHPYSGESRFRPFPWLLLCLLLTAPLALGQIGPVRDIFPTSAPAVTFNGKLYFAASSAATGTELYRSDLAGNNQELVKDINPGPSASWPRELTVVNGTLFLVAATSTGGPELWKTDGTAAGTVLVKDINAGATGSEPNTLTAVGSTLYFIATTAAAGRELWKSNGTSAGTLLVKNIATGAESTNLGSLANLNGTLFFATDSALWKSNGTATGTVPVAQVANGTGLTPFNGALYFSAFDQSNGQELWRSDGTTAGTKLLKNILEDSEDYGYRSSDPHWFRVVGNALYFIANAAISPEYWEPVATTIFRTDGTAAGIVEVGGAVPLSTRLSEASLSDVEVVGTDVYYSVYTRDLEQGFYINLSKVDYGTVKDFSSTQSEVTELTNVNGVLYFVVGNEEEGYNTLWRSDGTPGGTFRLPPVSPAYQYISGTGLFGLGKWLYFRTSYGTSEPVLWRYDTSKPLSTPIRVNAGGPKYTEVFVDSQGEGYEGDTYAADQYFAGGTPTTYPDPGGFDNGDGPLYLTGRRGQFSYNVPVPNGSYQVVLHFAEMYWGVNGQPGGVGSRRFNVDVEGVRRLSGYDIFARAGGAAIPVEEGLATQVTDGTLNISFVRGAADNPVVAAIEIIPGMPLKDVPVLAPIGDKTLAPGQTLTFTASATYEGPAGPLTYSLLPNNMGYAFPTGATINPATGAFSWKPSAPGSYGVTVRVSDSGNPAFYDEEQIAIFIPPRTDLTVLGSSQCNVTNGNGFTFQAVITVKNAEAGVTYGAYRNGIYYSPAAKGTGGDLTISFPFTSTAPAPVTYTFDVIIYTYTLTLAQKAQISLAPALSLPTAAGKTIASGQTATLTASTTQTGITNFRWYNASSGGTLLHTGSSFTTPALTATTTYYVAAAYGGCENSRRAVTVTVTGGTTAGTFRVNAGGNSFSTLDARNFSADAYFSGGSVSTASASPIAGTADDYLYQTGRHGVFSYNFPVTNGSYDVVLHFAETYFGNTGPGGIGSRKFHVNMEGARKLTDYDIFARAGGALRVAQETFRVNVADGTLNVAFLKGSADNPAVKAIEVLPAGSALTINSGGSAFTSSTGKKFSADSYYASGSVSSIASGEIANTGDDALYRNARVGVFSYGLPSGNGTFDVTLHFAETYWGSRAAGGAGSRRFNVFVENVKRLSDYDVFAKAGGAMRAVKETIRVTVSDGVLNLYFAKGLADNPLVSAIEVTPATVAARQATPEASAEDWQVTLFPNPVQDKLTVSLPFPAGQVRGTVVTDATGTVHLRNAHKVSGPNGLELRAAGLPKGLYLLRLDTQNGHRVVKFMKQ